MTQTGNLKEYTLRVQSFRVNSVGIVLQISDRVLNMIMMVTMLGTIESSWMYNLETSFQEGAMLLQEMKRRASLRLLLWLCWRLWGDFVCPFRGWCSCWGEPQKQEQASWWNIISVFIIFSTELGFKSSDDLWWWKDSCDGTLLGYFFYMERFDSVFGQFCESGWGLSEGRTFICLGLHA